jgi:hypothetical protein
MKLSNYWELPTTHGEDASQMTNGHFPPIAPFDRSFGDAWRRIVPLVSELRNSQASSVYQQGSVDSATMAASRFISLMPDNILELKRLIDFDVELDESVEFVFQGRQRVRVNLMLNAMQTSEEAFVVYKKNGRLTQRNGYMTEVMQILKSVL